MASNIATASKIYDGQGNLIDNPALTNPGIINGSLLEPQSQLPYVNPNPVITPSVPNLQLPPLQATPQEQEADSLTKRLQELNMSLTGESQARTQAEEAQGIPQLTQAQTELQNRLKALQTESLQIPLQLQQEATGRGITESGLRPIQTAALRNNAIQSLSISSLLEASRNNLSTAQSLADRAVEAKFAPLKAERDAKMQNLELLLKSPLTTLAEKNRAQAQLDIQRRQQAQEDRQKEDAKAGQALISAAMKNSGGSQEALLAINRALSLDSSSPNYVQEVFNQVGRFQTNPDEIRLAIENQRLQNRKLQADIDLTYATAEEKRASRRVADAVANLSPDSPQFTLDSIKASKGGKIPTGEQTKPINKAMLVVSQLDSLQSQISQIDTGPILGILRGANPYDVKAQLLKATLQATVPNLARGVYGEVGVLTDNDIANYIKTLPNIRSPKELSDMVLSMTMKVVKNSVDSNLQVLAAEGRDVSGFEPLYNRLQKKIGEIDARIGVQSGVLRSPDGTSEVNISDLTPEELKEAQEAGWK